MGLRNYGIPFSELPKDLFFRLDFDYFEIKNKLNLNHTDKLKKYLTFLETGKPIKPCDYTEESDNIHIVVRNIVDGKFTQNNLIYINDDKAEKLEKYRIEKGDVVIAISSNCGASFYYDGGNKSNLTLSHYLARFRVNIDFVNPVYLSYYINSITIKQYFRSVETGKTLKNLSKYYIKEMPCILPTLNEQVRIVSKIEPIEQNIKKLKSKIKAPQEVINRVFAREFNFNLERFETLKKVKIFDINYTYFGNNKDLRYSVKFHRQAGQFILDELKSHTRKKIKDFISEPIVLGKGISPAQYDDDNGEYYYLSMATIKNWKFGKENARLVTDKFASDNQNKTVQVDDILLARSGEGTIGKVAIITDAELKGVFADFTMRIRLKDYNSLFAYYYFRTEYFQSLKIRETER